MSDQIPYLSDEELQKLIADAEQSTTVKAPDDLEEKVIARIESREKKKTVEFSRYCARVVFGVAAAIALLCIAPSIPKLKLSDYAVIAAPVEKPIPTRAEVLGNTTIRTKEEVLSGVSDPSLFDELFDYFN